MRHRVIASALLAVVVTACGGDGRITEPARVPAKLTAVAAIGTDAVTGATIETDLDDYAPGGSVSLTGRGWAPNETVHLVMTEDPDTHADIERDVQTDDAGMFTLQFYTVQESDVGVRFTLTGTGATSGSRVTVQFTDGRTIDAITLTPPSPFAAGTNVSVAVRVVLNSGTGATTWTGTKWEIRNAANVIVASSPAPCLDTPNHSVGDGDAFSGNKHQESFAFVAPTAGSYTLTVSVYSTDNCAVASDATTASTTFTVPAVNAAPAVNAGSDAIVNEGATFSQNGSFTDPDANSWTATVNYGDGSGDQALTLTLPAKTFSLSHVYADNGAYNVTVTVNDGTADGSDDVLVTVNNVAPTATFNAPTSVSGGSPIALSLTSPVDPSTVDVTAGFTYAFDCGDGAGYDAFSATTTRSCPTSGTGSRTVKGKIKDKDGGETEYTASVAINNVAPTASAGGPYTGNEGSAINISGSGSDPDGGTVTYLWSVAPNDGACTFGSATSASTTVTCNDNGSWTLTLTVKDDENSSTPSNATLTVANVAPTATFNAPSPVNEGSSISLSLTNPVEPSSVDAATLQYAFDCGSGYGAFGASNSASCPTTDNGTRAVKGKIKDKDNGVTEYTASVTINNVAPTATFNAPGSVNEGSPIGLSLTGAFDPSSVDVAAGLEYAFDCGDGAGYNAFSATTTRSCPTTDNGPRTVKGKIKDKDNGVTEYSASVTVNNVAPNITSLTVPLSPVAAGPSNVTVTWQFDDPGTDTWTCAIDWDNGAGEQSATYAAVKGCTATTTLPAGIYTVTVRVTDDDGGTDTETATTYIVVYDPSAGFVTGGGWITSPLGAYRPNIDLTGKATFGFVAKYKKGQTVPDGNTEFQFHAASMNFKSNAYEWLVVAGAKGQFKGSGTINGSGNYGFMLMAVDGQVTGGGGTDKFRIKIWDKNNGDAIVYDNQFGADETADPTTVLGGGSINIQAK